MSIHDDFHADARAERAQDARDAAMLRDEQDARWNDTDWLAVAGTVCRPTPADVAAQDDEQADREYARMVYS